jgi:predicted nucleic acid-binding protein
LTVVLDASGAMEIALGNARSQEFKDALQRADVILAPDTFVSEIANAFWKYRKFANFPDVSCLKGIEFCISLIDDLVDAKQLWREAYFESSKSQSPTYDIFYLVTARRNSGVLISMDKKLNEIAEREGLKF